MRDPVVHLIVSDLFGGDAIGNFVLAVRAMLERRGIPCALYAERFAEAIAGVSPYAAFFDRAGSGDVLFYQLSNHDPAWGRIMAAPCRRVVYYHNITPGLFFAPYAPRIAAALDKGRAELSLIGRADVLLANSRHSLAEAEPWLPEAAPRSLFPPFLPEQPAQPEDSPSPASGLLRAAPQTPYLLTLGRVVPHKRIEAAMNIFARLRAGRPDLRLVVAGAPYAPYAARLRELRAASPILEEGVIFTGKLDARELAALLGGAAGLLHTSAHEGFCLPVLEAMRAKIPVFAHAQAAVAETLGGTGTLLDVDDPETAAGRIREVLSSPRRREALIAAQALRAGELAGLASEDRLLTFLGKR